MVLNLILLKHDSERRRSSHLYLDTVLSNNTRNHIDMRIKAAHRAFCGLQSAGLCANGVSPIVSAHMLNNVAIPPILSYGCSTLNADRNGIKEIDKALAKLLKSSLGLPKFCHNTPLLEALALKKIAKTLQVHQLSLLRNAIINNSKARTFYMYMIKLGTTQSDKNLITRCFNIRKTHHVSLMRYVFDERYVNQCKKQIHSVPQNGVTDSVRTLLTNYNQHSKQILKNVTFSILVDV